MSRRRCSVLFLLLSLSLLAGLTGCASRPPVASGPTLKVDSFTTQQGLPHESITALAYFANQIWAGTKNGICRYDGVNWQVHVKKNTNVLGSDLIESMTVADKALWIATDNGVTRFDGNNWSSISTGARARAVTAKGSEIAVATAHGVDYSTGGAFEAKGKENGGLIYDEVQAVAYDASGKLWVGTRMGMALLQGGAYQNFTGPAQQPMGTQLVEIPPSPPNCQLVGNNIAVILPFKGKLAIGTSSGLSITDMANDWISFTGPHKKYVQRAGKIIEEFDPGNSPLPGNPITSLAATEGDTILFVGTTKGLAAWKDGAWLDLAKAAASLPAGGVTAVGVEKEILWVGTARGLYRVEGLLPTLLSATK